MIKAYKAAEITEQAYIKKRDELYQHINDMILKAANDGLSSCNINDSVYFDDIIIHTLEIAGYHIRYINSDWGDFYKLSWSGNKC